MLHYGWLNPAETTQTNGHESNSPFIHPPPAESTECKSATGETVSLSLHNGRRCRQIPAISKSSGSLECSRSLRWASNNECDTVLELIINLHCTALLILLSGRGRDESSLSTTTTTKWLSSTLHALAIQCRSAVHISSPVPPHHHHHRSPWSSSDFDSTEQQQHCPAEHELLLRAHWTI